MARLKLLWLLASFFSLICAGSINNTEKPKNQCPKYCKCEHIAMYVTNVKCNKITQTQYFMDPIVSFTLEKDVDINAEPLELTKKFFTELGSNFIYVDSMLITADLDKIDRDAFQGLNSLTNLNISSNGLTYIHPDTFYNNDELTLLALTRNPLRFGEYFLNSTKLSELDLSFCLISNLPENAFIALKELTYLNLESNLIDTIHPRTFVPLAFLEELNLAHNNLHAINPDLFLTNEALNVLGLGHNPLTSIENLKLPSIEDLYLQHCKFTELTATTFSSYIVISHLNLSGNSIEKVSPDAFSKLRALMYLDLSNNRLGPLDSRLFSENSYLETLNLRDNPNMLVWPEEGFQGDFAKLHRLDISNTGIQSLALGSLKNMSNLAQLDLSRNAFKGFGKGVLPQKIKFLSLSNNEIKSIDDINVSSEYKIRHLLLQGNKIKNLIPRNFENLPYLSRLDVSSCEMESVWLEGQSGEHKIKNMHQLNLANNKLQKISPDDLNVFTNLDMLDIRGNPFMCNEDLDTLINYLQNSSIEPIGSSNIGNIDENIERFDWDDIKINNCDSPPKSAQKPSKPVKPVSKKPYLLPPTTTPPTDEREFVVGDMYEDIISDDDDFEYDQDNYETTRVSLSHHKIVLTPQIVEVSDTSPVVVAFLSALLMTVVVTLMLALLTAICKHKFVTINDIRKRPRPHKDRCSIYRALPENEHLNSPTTPIVKKKVHLPEIDDQAKKDSYIRSVNDGTYSSTDFHHSNITPQTV